MPWRSAAVAAETETDTEMDKTETSLSGLADSTPGCLTLDHDPGQSDRGMFNVVTAANTNGPIVW